MPGFHQAPLFFNNTWNTWKPHERAAFLQRVPHLDLDDKEVNFFAREQWNELPLLIKDLIEDYNHTLYLDEMELLNWFD